MDEQFECEDLNIKLFESHKKGDHSSVVQISIALPYTYGDFGTDKHCFYHFIMPALEKTFGKGIHVRNFGNADDDHDTIIVLVGIRTHTKYKVSAISAKGWKSKLEAVHGDLVKRAEAVCAEAIAAYDADVDAKEELDTVERLGHHHAAEAVKKAKAELNYDLRLQELNESVKSLARYIASEQLVEPWEGVPGYQKDMVREHHEEFEDRHIDRVGEWGLFSSHNSKVVPHDEEAVARMVKILSEEGM
jgi:hypothetical protein